MVPSVAYNDLGNPALGMCSGRRPSLSPPSSADLAVRQVRRTRKATSRAVETEFASDDIGQHPSQPGVGHIDLVVRATDWVHAPRPSIGTVMVTAWPRAPQGYCRRSRRPAHRVRTAHIARGAFIRARICADPSARRSYVRKLVTA